eukprot:gene7742-8582_t
MAGRNSSCSHHHAAKIVRKTSVHCRNLDRYLQADYRDMITTLSFVIIILIEIMICRVAIPIAVIARTSDYNDRIHDDNDCDDDHYDCDFDCDDCSDDYSDCWLDCKVFGDHEKHRT